MISDYGDAGTIVARATPAGSGGVAVLRVSGPMARQVLSSVFAPSAKNFSDFVPWKLHRGRALDAEGEPFDDVLAVFMPGPKTFTGEDVAEIHCHGGQAVVRVLLESCIAAGAVLARRGEFSRRAFLNGRMDLSQAEAVAETIAAPSREALRYSFKRLEGVLASRVGELRRRLEGLRVQLSLAIDFPDDEVECLPPEEFLHVAQGVRESLEALLRGFSRSRLAQEGALVVLAGSVNAGKSSLLNAFLGRNRALVTDIPGTTRDFLEEQLDFEGTCVRLVDTAGLRDSSDPVEALGVERSREKLSSADCILLVVDGSAIGPQAASAQVCPDDVVRETLDNGPDVPVVLVWNKVDLAEPSVFPPVWAKRGGRQIPSLAVSAKNGDNLDELARLVSALLSSSMPGAEDFVAPNLRQAEALSSASKELWALCEAIGQGLPYDLLSVHLDAACMGLRDTIGLGTVQDVLNNVFSQFCIGK